MTVDDVQRIPFTIVRFSGVLPTANGFFRDLFYLGPILVGISIEKL